MLPTASRIRKLTQLEIYGVAGLGVPTVDTWERALELAELGSARRGAARRGSARGSERVQPLPLLELFDRYWAATGREPTPQRLWLSRGRRTCRTRRPSARGSGAKSPTSGASAEKLPGCLRRSRPSLLLQARMRSCGCAYRTSARKGRTRAGAIPRSALKRSPATSNSSGGTTFYFSCYTAWANQQKGNAPSLPALAKHGGWLKLREVAHQRILRNAARSTNQQPSTIRYLRPKS